MIYHLLEEISTWDISVVCRNANIISLGLGCDFCRMSGCEIWVLQLNLTHLMSGAFIFPLQ